MKNILLLGIFIASIALASGVLAISKPAPESSAVSKGSTTDKRGIFSGVIEKVDETGATIVVTGKKMMEVKTLIFSIDNKTKITKSRSSIAPQDLKKGMSATIEYHQNAGTLTAIIIDVSAP